MRRKTRLTLLDRMPRHPGTLHELMQDLNVTGREVARAFAVSARSVRRWRSHEPPKSVLLALWWLTPAGRDAWDCEMTNRTRQALALWAAVARDGLNGNPAIEPDAPSADPKERTRG